MSRKGQGDSEPGVPIWVLSFGDMITNLLAFFILLQSFSHAQRADLLQTGAAGAPSMAIDLSGVPRWLLGFRPQPCLGFQPRKYAVEPDPDNLAPERIIDAEDEKIRKLFDDLRRSISTEVSDLHRGAMRIIPTPILFQAGAAALSPQDADFLTTLAAELPQDPSAPKLDIYVIGFAPDTPGRQQQCILSALRAQAVYDALNSILPPELRTGGTRLFSWGAGSGREGPHALTALRQPHIVVAVRDCESQE